MPRGNAGRLSCPPAIASVARAALGLLLLGCAADPGRPATPPTQVPSARIAVAPPEWATEETLDVHVSAAITKGFAGARVEVLDPRPAMAARGEACAADPTCVQGIARDLRADKLLKTRLATLGGTVLVRVGLVDVATGTRAEERQEVVNEASAQRVEAALTQLARGLARPYTPPPPAPPPPARWYESWWVWTLIGAAAVGGGVAIGAAALAQDPGPDVVITPP
jgi:hypothetical protein